MTHNEKLKLKLKKNLLFVGSLFGLTTIWFVYKLYQIYWASPTLYEIQVNLIFKDYIVFLLFGIFTTVKIVWSGLDR